MATKPDQDHAPSQDPPRRPRRGADRQGRRPPRQGARGHPRASGRADRREHQHRQAPHQAAPRQGLARRADDAGRRARDRSRHARRQRRAGVPPLQRSQLASATGSRTTARRSATAAAPAATQTSRSPDRNGRDHNHTAAPARPLRERGARRAPGALRVPLAHAAAAPAARSRSTWASARPSRTRRRSTRPSSSWRSSPGQRPLITKAKKSIAGFKLREGMPIGCKVTLRGARMWEFLDRLMAVALPRIRDFRGLDPGVVRRPRQLLAGRARADHLSRDRLRPDRYRARARRDHHDDREHRRRGTRAAASARNAVQGGVTWRRRR